VSMKSRLESIATGIMVVCAVSVTLLFARRELLSSHDTSQPRFEQTRDWRSFVVGDEWIGPASAPVTVVVFSDFECPFCRKLSSELDAVSAKHPGAIGILHRNFPLTALHPFARMAAVAAECAAAQGRFAAYHQYLFEHQDSLGTLSWVRVARVVQVPDVKGFERCVRLDVPAARLVADSEAAVRLHITGTPLIMVNGLRTQGAPPERILDSLVVRQERSVGDAVGRARTGSDVGRSSR
jgi:thiol-disulfide isomerase/thioredoxin